MSQRGMSLLEVSLALLLLSILFGFALPRLPLLTESALERESKRIGYLIQITQEKAILQGRDFRLLLNSTEQSLTLLGRDPESLEYTLVERKNNPLILPSGVRFSRFDSQVTKASTFGFTPIRFEKIFGEEFIIEIDDSGLVDQFEIELAQDRNKMTLVNSSLMGRIKIIGPESL